MRNQLKNYIWLLIISFFHLKSVALTPLDPSRTINYNVTFSDLETFHKNARPLKFNQISDLKMDRALGMCLEEYEGWYATPFEVISGSILTIDKPGSLVRMIPAVRYSKDSLGRYINPISYGKPRDEAQAVDFEMIPKLLDINFRYNEILIHENLNDFNFLRSVAWKDYETRPAKELLSKLADQLTNDRFSIQHKTYSNNLVITYDIVPRTGSAQYPFQDKICGDEFKTLPSGDFIVGRKCLDSKNFPLGSTNLNIILNAWKTSGEYTRFCSWFYR